MFAARVLVLGGALASVVCGLSAPVLPAYWTSQFSGQYFDKPNCTHNGFVYYNADLMLMRTDEFKSPGCYAGALNVPWGGVTSVADGNHHEVRQYDIQFNQTTFTCAAFPSLGFIRPDYLVNGTYLGSAAIVTSLGPTITANLWNSTGQYMAGYLLSYTDPVSNVLLRHEVYLGIAPAYSLDFYNFNAGTSDGLTPELLNPFPSIPCMPF